MRKIHLWEEPWALSLLSAILLWLSFPPNNLGLLQIPAFVLLIRLSVISVSVRQMIFYAYPSFLLWNLLTTYWLMMATISGGLAAITANAALMLIPLGLIRYFYQKNLHPVLFSLFAAATWISYEYLHHQWDLAWPWLTLGNAWANLTSVIQYISVTGVWGISFWVVFTAALTYQSIITRSKSIWKLTVVILFTIPILSQLSILTIQQAEDRPLNVLIVQPNSDSYEDYGGHTSLDDLVSHLLTLSDSGRTDSTNLILWPENAIDSPLTPDSYLISRIRDSLEVWDTELITGSNYLKFYENDSAPAVTRGMHNNRQYSMYNAAFHISESDTEIYEKGKLVPVVERFPFVEFFQTIDYFNWVDWGIRMGYGLGREATVFSVDGGKTPALICYDSVFPGWVNQFVANGADFLTIVTNDGWWGDSHGHIQHFAYARLRSIEQRRWIARSANNGISGVISPDGRVQMETEYWTEDVISHQIYRSRHKTIYARFGDWLPLMMIVLSTGGLLYMRFKRRFELI